MATIEGLGKVCPRPISVQLTRCDLLFASSVAERRNAHRGYGGSSSQWRRGSCDDPVLVGTVGELALEKYLRSRGLKCSIVSEELNNGDGGVDFEFCGVQYQVKTSGKEYPTVLVRRVNENGITLPLVADRFVFCKWSAGETVAKLRGWCTDVEVMNGEFQRGRSEGCKWFNTEVKSSELMKMSDLVMRMKWELSRVK